MTIADTADWDNHVFVTNTPATAVPILPPAPPTSAAFTNVFTIASTGVKQQLNAFPLTVGMTCLAHPKNAADMNIGGSNVTTSSFLLPPGATVTFGISNGNIIWILGTAGDRLSVWGY